MNDSGEAAASDDPLASLSAEDFNGHTAFADLTPAERLDALGQMIAVVASFKGIASRAQEQPVGPRHNRKWGVGRGPHSK
jgi:hypothetical protein